MRLITVETGLSEIKDFLNERGYDVTDLEKCARSVEAVVYSGQALPALGRYPCATNTVLVNATGVTPQEVAEQLENRLG